MNSDRRQVLKILGATPAMAAAQTPDAPSHQHAAQAASATSAVAAYKQKSFTPQQWRTVRVLADLVIPADDKSGSATQAGVPEYIDEVLNDRRVRAGVENRFEAQLKGGLAWLDREARQRFQQDFADCQPAQQRQILDLIAWPRKAAPEHAAAVAFFNRFRDLCAGGFYTSKIGIADLQFKGNRAVDHWDGCPPEVLSKLGL